MTRLTERQWWLLTLALYTRRLSRAVRAVLAKLAKELATTLADLSLVELPLFRLNVAKWAAELRKAGEPILRDAFLVGLTDEWQRHGQSNVYPVRLPRATLLLGLILAAAAWDRPVLTIQRAVALRLRGQVAAGVDRATAIRRAVDVVRGPALGNRADRIAEIQTHTAINGGKEAMRDELVARGLIAGKRWNTVGDERVRDAHADAEGQEVPVGQEFIVGGERARYPGDPRLSLANRIGCRCWASSVEVKA
jgi:hypothetical protein